MKKILVNDFRLNMLTKKKSIIIGITLGLLVFIFINTFNFAGWFFTIKWHLTHDDEIHINNLSLKLPLRWWVYRVNNQMYEITCVPPFRNKIYGIVTIKDDRFGKEGLKKLEGIKNIGLDTIETAGYFVRQIGNKEAFGILHLSKSKATNMRLIYETWVIPSENLRICGIGIMHSRKDLYDRLINKIQINR